MIKPGMFISDRYEIIDKVGSGGMADVYKARCHRLNRFVAIKVLKPEYSDDKTFVAKFRGEAQSVAGLSHPNVVNVYDVGEDDGLYYIVMELVEGITLKNFIERKGKLEVKEAVGIAIQIAQGMEAAHTNKIIHRDIKPQNIIISREGKVKVMDFGIAKAATSNTITSNAMGSVHYISPEQARGGYSDEKSDIYSLGVTLYEMLSGDLPFAGDNTVSVALLHIQEEAVPLRELNPSIPVCLEKIVQKCMQKKPERRYLSAAELIIDLKQAISNPNGDFVKLSSGLVDDSPTINISDEEVKEIKKTASKVNMDNTQEINTRDSGKSELYPPEEEESEEDEEDEDEGDIDPKLEKLMVIGGIVMAVILVFIIIFIIAKANNLFPSGNKGDNETGIEQDDNNGEEDGQDGDEETQNPVKEEVKMPNVVGRKFEDVERELIKLEIVYKPEEKISDVMEAGYIMEQSIAPDTVVESTDTVILTVSLGKEKVKVPNVIGKSSTAAINMLDDVGLNVKRTYDYSDKAKDTVISTNPAADTEVSVGDTITIVISDGEEYKTTTVPDILNKTKSEAETAIKNANLTVGQVTTQTSETVAEGRVISADYTIGSKVQEGTKISFTVSSGPEVKEYKYVATIEITNNPFYSNPEEGVTEGMIVLELIQDGEITSIYEEYEDYDSFPLHLQIESSSGTKAEVKMYLDGEPINGKTVVEFKKVEK